MSHAVNKITAERNQRVLLELVAKPGNDTCADCKARTPRWASHNLGIFLCMNCASIHRKIGTHITKVKSVTMDSWTKEQVESMKQNGNVKSNSYYNPDEVRHPPPTNMMESERDSELELYIRGKYQYKKFIDRSAIAASQLGPSQSAPSRPPRPRSTPVVNAAPLHPTPSSTAPLPSSNQPQLGSKPEYRPATAASNLSSGSTQIKPTRSISQPLTSLSHSQQQQPPPSQVKSNNPIWDDLISLQGPAQTSSLPLQFQPNATPVQPSVLPASSSNLISNTNPYANISASPGYPSQANMSGPPAFPTGGMMGNMNTGMGMGMNPFQQQPAFSSNTPPVFSQGGAGLSNPFTQPFPPPSDSVAGFGGMVTQASNPSFQSQQFGYPQQQQFFQPQVQSPVSMQSQPNFFHPQPQPAQQPQQQSFTSQQSFGGTPSPFSQQPQPQPQPQNVFTPGNPFGNWQQGQQWGGM